MLARLFRRRWERRGYEQDGRSELTEGWNEHRGHGTAVKWRADPSEKTANVRQAPLNARCVTFLEVKRSRSVILGQTVRLPLFYAVSSLHDPLHYIRLCRCLGTPLPLQKPNL